MYMLLSDVLSYRCATLHSVDLLSIFEAYGIALAIMLTWKLALAVFI